MIDSSMVNVLIGIAALILTLLTLAEILTVVSSFCISIYQINFLAKHSIWEMDTNFQASTICLLVTSILLIIGLILNWIKTFNKIIHIFRLAATILFSASAIYFIVIMRKSNENLIFEQISTNWSDSEIYRNYEKTNSCDTPGNSCSEILHQQLNQICRVGRGLNAPFSLFWVSSVIYAIASVVIMSAKNLCRR